ncbi:MAG TPA: urease accessory protein UreD, partial [Abditibacteriaceae bacterium]|nr:urease accessory protein UreD [Abditibacteriaceae bacterium]
MPRGSKSSTRMRDLPSEKPDLEPSQFASPNHSSSTHSGGYVRATFDCSRGATRLARAAFGAPLKVAKPFPQGDGSLSVCLMDCSPGLLAGDHYLLDWQLEPDAQVVISNQSFTKVHPSGDQPCSQTQTVSVARNARLDYVPQPTILYRDADFRNCCNIEIEADGTLLWSEIVCAGRIAHGEAWQFRSYANRLAVRYDNELVFCNQTLWQPLKKNLRTIGAWESSTHYGQVVFICEPLASSHLQ